MKSINHQFISNEIQNELNIELVDSSATKETVLLFYNLKMLSESKILFGHQDALDYGVGWRGDSDRSDVKSVVGSHPALIGSDFIFLSMENNLEQSIEFRKSKIREVYNQNGISSFSWHYGNPVSNGNYNDTTNAVSKILPGGEFHSKFLSDLDKIADFVNNLIDSSGNHIPIIFRPFHEFECDWFWWGKPYCSPDEFKELWRCTVTYLRDKRNVNSIIYAFSSDRKFNSLKEYLDRYPGDEYVDLLGMDNYHDFTFFGGGVNAVSNKLKIISQYAQERNKIAALTETGLESIKNEKWWTEELYRSLERNSIKLAYVMVWRNHDTNHHFAPYPGHPSVKDFIEFYHKEKILFATHMPNIYKKILTDEDIFQIENMKKAEE